MGIDVMSRYARVRTIQVTDADSETFEVYELPQTTVLEADLYDEFMWYTIVGDEKFEDIAHEAYHEVGGDALWWVLAMVNPEVFYPLDLSAGTRIRVPSQRWVQDFLSTRDDWKFTWRSIIR